MNKSKKEFFNLNDLDTFQKNYNQILTSKQSKLMQTEPERRSSSRGSYHSKSQNYLIQYFANEMGLSEQSAYLLVSVHGCKSLPDAMELFLQNQNNLYNHIFIPSEQNLLKCDICETQSDNHQFVNAQAIKQALAEYSQFQIEALQNPKHRSFLRSHSEKLKTSFSSIEEQQKPYKDNQMLKRCQICYIGFEDEDLVRIKQQIHEICLECMGTYIKEEINNMRVETIRCPHCDVKLLPEIIREYVDNTVFKKYNVFLRNLQIQKNPNLKYCPNSKCSIVIIVNENKKTSKCPKCQTQICNKCNRQAHPKRSCNDVFKNQIKGWENSIDIQKCKRCQGMVEKVSGCNHMTCSVCRYQWCWLCGGTYSSAHFNSLNPFGCPGLQNNQRQNWGKCKIMSWRILLFTLILISIPIILPIAMIVCGPLLIGHVLWQKYYPHDCLPKVAIILISIPLGIISNPFVWVGALVIYIPKGIMYIYDYFRQRRQNKLYSNELLKEKLISQAENLYDQNQILK